MQDASHVHSLQGAGKGYKTAHGKMILFANNSFGTRCYRSHLLWLVDVCWLSVSHLEPLAMMRPSTKVLLELAAAGATASFSVSKRTLIVLLMSF